MLGVACKSVAADKPYTRSDEQKTGHVVGDLGDGINDAAALHTADVGISVDKAMDVAKEAADFVLLEHNLDVLCQRIDEGRHTFANTLKYIFVTSSANFGNMITFGLVSTAFNRSVDLWRFVAAGWQPGRYVSHGLVRGIPAHRATDHGAVPGCVRAHQLRVFPAHRLGSGKK